MRIVIDMQGAQTTQSRHGGVGRYTENLVRGLLLHNKKYEFYLALNGHFSDTIEDIRKKFSGLIEDDHIVVWQNFLYTASHFQPEFSVIEAAEIIREIFLNSLEPDIIFSTNLQEGFVESAVTSVHKLNFPSLYCSTLHDLVPFYYDAEYLGNQPARGCYFQKIDYAIASDILLTDSYDAKKDIIEKLGVNEDKVFILDLGFDKTMFNASKIDAKIAKGLPHKYKIKKPFVLYVGGNDNHKNLDRLIRAFALLPSKMRNKTDLVLAGKSLAKDENIRRMISSLGLTNNVITPGFVADHDLPVLFKMCECFVFPSTHEGFGLPALEAMACGAPVIGSNNSSIKEVIVEKDFLFDPYKEADIAKKIGLVLSNPSFRQAAINNGLKQAQATKYSWDDSAKKLLNIFEQFGRKADKKEWDLSDPVAKVVQEISHLMPTLKDEVLVDVARSISETFSLCERNVSVSDLQSVMRGAA